MSKSYKKILRLGVCTGSNTKFYRYKRRRYRRIARQKLASQLEEFVNPEDLESFKDVYCEPTDGTFLVDLQYLIDNFADSKWYKKLKPRLKK